jgi:drug/metabolite transporter (DMT)-like permease
MVPGGKETSMFRVLVVTFIATISAAAGQILVKKGMQVVGPLEGYAPLHLLAYFWKALCQPYVIGGTVLNAVFYFCVLAALSWASVTVVFPITSIEYLIAAVLAIAYLGENIPTMRWIGIVLVVAGVIFIGMAGDETVNPHTPAKIEHRSSNL